MKKRFRFIGLLMIVLGIVISISNLRITGFVVSREINLFFTSVLGLIIMGLGIATIVVGDSLQGYLKKKEDESLSPSLRRKRKQTLREKLGFGIRSVLGGLAVKRKGLSERELSEKRRGSDFRVGDEYDQEFKKKYGGSEYSDRGLMITRGESDSYPIKMIGEFKEDFNELKRQINLNLRDELATTTPNPQKIRETLERLEHFSEMAGLNFPRKHYEDLLKKKGREGTKMVMKMAKELVSKDEATSLNKINEYVNALEGWRELSGRSLSDSRRNKLIEGFVGRYSRTAPTIPVSDISRDYGVTLVHGLPIRNNPVGKGKFNYHSLKWNKHWENYERKGGSLESLRLEDFLENIARNKPSLSTSAIRDNSKDSEFFTPHGIIINEGRVYDAFNNGKDSYSYSANPRKTKMRLDEVDRRPLAERVRSALGEKPKLTNELILGGGDYEIGGLYYVENPQTEYDGTIGTIAKLAIEKHLPLYRFREGEGLNEVNPKEILKEDSKNSKRVA